MVTCVDSTSLSILTPRGIRLSWVRLSSKLLMPGGLLKLGQAFLQGHFQDHFDRGPKAHGAVNMPEINCSFLRVAKKRVEFDVSCIMSTYLVAWCIGEFTMCRASPRATYLCVSMPPRPCFSTLRPGLLYPLLGVLQRLLRSLPLAQVRHDRHHRVRSRCHGELC